MPDVSLERQFAGQARLVRLLLWRIGETTDLAACLRAASDAGMVSADDAAFLSACLAAEEAERASGELPADLALDEQLLARLRRSADKLNRADSA